MAKRIRPVKFMIQPVLVLDDDDGFLIEMACEPITVAAADWEDFSAVEWPKLLAQQEARLQELPPPPAG